ncbi:MAG: hypothetical protein Q8761_02950 [Sweet potato little leaf phytoplasma]|nr:hypothetical protein [Sweet potato little leaf phytoplasma]
MAIEQKKRERVSCKGEITFFLKRIPVVQNNHLKVVVLPPKIAIKNVTW